MIVQKSKLTKYQLGISQEFINNVVNLFNYTVLGC